MVFTETKYRYSVAVQDLASHWIQSYPCKTKTSQETERSLPKCLGGVSKRAHLRVPALQIPPKIPREDLLRERKKAKMGAREGKKSTKFWASHPSGPHPLGTHPSGPPHLRGFHSSGPSAFLPGRGWRTGFLYDCNCNSSKNHIYIYNHKKVVLSYNYNL